MESASGIYWSSYQRQKYKIYVACGLRVLFRFRVESHITDGNFEDILSGYKWVKREKIPSLFNTDGVRDIDESVDKSSGVGKHNYAMLLLASRLGLRASDIANLKFSNINWDKNEIRLTQYKTGHPTTLPLLNDIGNAIIDTSNMAALSLNLRRFLSPLALRMSRPTKG